MDVPEWKQQLVTIFPEQAEQALGRQSGKSASADRAEETVEDLFTIDGGWSVEALEDEDDGGGGGALLFDEVPVHACWHIAFKTAASKQIIVLLIFTVSSLIG